MGRIQKSYRYLPLIKDLESRGSITEKESKILRLLYQSYRKGIMEKREKKLKAIERGKMLDPNVAKDALKPLVKKNESEEENDNWNTTCLNHVLSVNLIKKPNLDSPKQIFETGMTYLKLCQTDNVKPTISGLALSIGVTRTTLLTWIRGESRTQNADVIRRLFQLVEMYDEASAKQNKTNVVWSVFNAKNNYGYADKVEVVNKNDTEMTNEEIKKKYAEMEGIIDIDATEKKA